MLVTEDEAKKKVCCESFAIPMIDGLRESGPWPCKGTDCMAWRWAENLHRDREKVGYCGKAGKP